MQNQKFDPPVIVLDSSGNQYSVSGAQIASDFLLKSWPGKRGEKHRAALQACSDSIADRKPSSSARKAFVAAAREAGVLSKH